MYEKRFVILESKQSNCFETVLPKDAGLEDAKAIVKDAWRAVQCNQVKTTVELAVMDYDKDSDELDYSSYDLIEY